MEQPQIREAGLTAESEAKGHAVDQGNPKNQEMQEQAADPSSTFPEAPLDSTEQLKAVADHQGPVGSIQGLKTGDQMAIRPPVAGKSGEQDMRGDMVGGINRHVGDFVGSVGDTEVGRKGTGGVDFSNAGNQV